MKIAADFESSTVSTQDEVASFRNQFRLHCIHYSINCQRPAASAGTGKINDAEPFSEWLAAPEQEIDCTSVFFYVGERQNAAE